MRQKSSSRALLAGLVAVAVIATGAGCSSSDKGSSATSSSPAASSAAAAAPTAAAATDPDSTAINDAFVTFFNGQTPAATRAGLIEKGAQFQPVLEATAGQPQAQGTSVTVTAVKIKDPEHADVTYTMLMGGNPVLPNQNGQAVKDGGQWKVAAATFCALLALQGGASVPACS